MNGFFSNGDGFAIALSGDQVRFVRTVLRDKQPEFAKRIAISHSSIKRIERRGAEKIVGPEIVLVAMLADAFGIDIPDKVVVDPSNPE